VTGASSGLGLSMALTLARAGAKVAVAARRVDRLESLCADIAALDGRAVAVAMDVTDAASVAAGFARAQAEFGTLDICVNNAGIVRKESPDTPDDAAWRDTMATNLDGANLVARTAAAAMRAHGGGGSIVNIASIGGMVATHICAAYHSSKGGVRLLSKHAAVAYGPDNIRSNAICPSTIMTDMVAGLPPKLRDAAAKGTALRRFGTTEEVARCAVFLASDEAAFITGADIPVDGGITAMRPSAPADN
jgi:NAD(P)-dependent dehydrogenase (short-subunit alcohol dehydrogenase family)